MPPDRDAEERRAGASSNIDFAPVTVPGSVETTPVPPSHFTRSVAASPQSHLARGNVIDEESAQGSSADRELASDLLRRELRDEGVFASSRPGTATTEDNKHEEGEEDTAQPPERPESPPLVPAQNLSELLSHISRVAGPEEGAGVPSIPLPTEPPPSDAPDLPTVVPWPQREPHLNVLPPIEEGDTPATILERIILTRDLHPPSAAGGALPARSFLDITVPHKPPPSSVPSLREDIEGDAAVPSEPPDLGHLQPPPIIPPPALPPPDVGEALALESVEEAIMRQPAGLQDLKYDDRSVQLVQQIIEQLEREHLMALKHDTLDLGRRPDTPDWVYRLSLGLSHLTMCSMLAASCAVLLLLAPRHLGSLADISYFLVLWTAVLVLLFFFLDLLRVALLTLALLSALERKRRATLPEYSIRHSIYGATVSVGHGAIGMSDYTPPRAPLNTAITSPHSTPSPIASRKSHARVSPQPPEVGYISRRTEDSKRPPAKPYVTAASFLYQREGSPQSRSDEMSMSVDEEAPSKMTFSMTPAAACRGESERDIAARTQSDFELPGSIPGSPQRADVVHQSVPISVKTPMDNDDHDCGSRADAVPLPTVRVADVSGNHSQSGPRLPMPSLPVPPRTASSVTRDGLSPTSFIPITIPASALASPASSLDPPLAIPTEDHVEAMPSGRHVPGYERPASFGLPSPYAAALPYGDHGYGDHAAGTPPDGHLSLTPM
ncbi:unnamed protein product [Vitrella brassicaformis CCMP3155]|uniref:Uncharacterized protein n=1 Tax=Vitrella brassicaformis (strain CCMP3155) TaxID=1169540 RepID=A0A0G4EIL9_VITBC|nr:unnamed protein product [Vitrella brassicaformis CCMP3155]|eukprot:CEL95832.1 unnamed protein product [Vitrella brassicaformis CCMP3155]